MNEISIAIKISRFSFASEYLTAELNLQPTHSHCQGEQYSLKTAKGVVNKTYAYNYWEFRHEFKTAEWVQPLIDGFVKEIIYPRKEVLKALSNQCALEFFVGIDYYGIVNPSFHFESELITILSDIGAELDMDLYCFK